MEKEKYMDIYIEEYKKRFNYLSYLFFMEIIKAMEKEEKQFENILKQLYN